MSIGSTAANPASVNHLSPAIAGVDLVRRYPACRNKNGTYKFRNIDVFAETVRKDKTTGKSYHFDRDFLASIVKTFQEERDRGFYPPFKIGHDQEDEANVGVITDIRMEDVKGVPTLFADVDNIPHDKFVFCAQGRFPYRSVEIPDPTVPRVSALSLLGNTPPYFKFPMFVPTLESDDTLCFAENPEGKGTLHFVGHFRAPAEALTEPTKAAMKFAHGFPQDYDPRDDYEGEDDGGFDDENSEGGESSGEDYSDLDDPGERQMMMGAEQGNEDDMAKLAELLQPMIESGIAKAMANLQPQTGITAQTPPAMVSSAPKGINFADERISPREQALLDSINDLKMKFSEDHAKLEAFERAGAEEEAFQKFSALADAECAKMKAEGQEAFIPGAIQYFSQWLPNKLQALPVEKWDEKNIQVGMCFAEFRKTLPAGRPEKFVGQAGVQGPMGSGQSNGGMAFDEKGFLEANPRFKPQFANPKLGPKLREAAAAEIGKFSEVPPSYQQALYDNDPNKFVAGRLSSMNFAE